MSGSPSIGSLFAQRVVIGVGDLAVSNHPQTILSTYALGSCIGLVAYDSLVRAGGILHLMLPDSALSPEKAARQPAMFADTGLPQFFRALAGLKVQASRLRLYMAGGASVIAGNDPFRIGERNIQATLRLLARYQCPAPQQDVGGTFNRTLHLELDSGRVTLKTPLSQTQCSLAP